MDNDVKQSSVNSLLRCVRSCPYIIHQMLLYSKKKKIKRKKNQNPNHQIMYLVYQETMKTDKFRRQLPDITFFPSHFHIIY